MEILHGKPSDRCIDKLGNNAIVKSNGRCRHFPNCAFRTIRKSDLEASCQERAAISCKVCQQCHTAGRLGGSGARVRSSVISRSYRRRMIQKSAYSISGSPKPPLIASRSRNTEGWPHLTHSPRMVEVTSRHWAHSKRFLPMAGVAVM
jgi:hypothetical protein